MKDLETRLVEHRAALRKHRQTPPRNINQEMEVSFTVLDRIALFVTERVGTFGFFLVIFFWTVSWLGWNLLAPASISFDPAPAFVLWLFISNMVQLFLLPLIIIGQNLQGRHAELRAENDFEINKKAEHEVETILLHLDRQAMLIEREEGLILEILGRLDARMKEMQEGARGSAGIDPDGHS